MSYVEQFDVKHKRLNEPIKERERAMEHTHISDTVKIVSVLHHFFIAPAAAAIFPFVLNSVPRTRSRASCFGNFIAIFQILPRAKWSTMGNTGAAGVMGFGYGVRMRRGVKCPHQ